MNVNKIILILILISTSLFADKKDSELIYSDFYDSKYEILVTSDIGFIKNVKTDTKLEYNLLLGFNYYLSKKIELNLLLNTSLGNNEVYGTMIKLDRKLYQIYLGSSYRFFHKKKHLFLAKGGFKLLYENQKRYFEKGSPDIKIEYEGKNSSFFDYAPYIGVGWQYLFLKSKKTLKIAKKRGVVSFRTDILYEYLINLNEGNFHINFSLSYIF